MPQERWSDTPEAPTEPEARNVPSSPDVWVKLGREDGPRRTPQWEEELTTEAETEEGPQSRQTSLTPETSTGEDREPKTPRRTDSPLTERTSGHHYRHVPRGMWLSQVPLGGEARGGSRCHAPCRYSRLARHPHPCLLEDDAGAPSVRPSPPPNPVPRHCARETA
ncbi:hypothetical protein NDU88_002746 [Pleurodeles waltl]|uniref:Uncharacterized protein n=1 Tax=Pleurodeles waltl TaxID=8319 RepID=A0AAV7PAX9_PLEWA|nr:hypothetical protein NDU88_002746 [Pleurodeles waltl]